MTKKNEVYKCNVCGNIVEVLHAGKGELVCCGKPMQLLKPKNKDAGNEKHVPIIKKTRSGIKVIVGLIKHPMERKHYIEWIELIADGKILRKHLKPGDKPEAEFKISAKKITAREYCSVHGYWST